MRRVRLDNVKPIYIKPDLTPLQREESKKLIEERNAKSEQEETQQTGMTWIIRRGKVTRVPKLEREPLGLEGALEGATGVGSPPAPQH